MTDKEKFIKGLAFRYVGKEYMFPHRLYHFEKAHDTEHHTLNGGGWLVGEDWDGYEDYFTLEIHGVNDISDSCFSGVVHLLGTKTKITVQFAECEFVNKNK